MPNIKFNTIAVLYVFRIAVFMRASNWTMVVKKYGLIALFTGKKCKHAAIGRAKRTFFGSTCNHRDTLYSVEYILANLRREREQWA